MNENVWTAASDGDIEEIERYVASGGDIDAQDEHAYTPLYVIFVRSIVLKARKL